MNNIYLTPSERKAVEHFCSQIIPNLINTDDLFDLKKVSQQCAFELLKASSKSKKAPNRWTTDTLCVDKNYFSRHL